MKKLTFIAALFCTLLLQSCYVRIHDGGHHDHHEDHHEDRH